MIPDLMEETRIYWRKLDELEAAYQRDEVTLEEVDAQVQDLMEDLGQSRREAFRALWASTQQTLRQQWETIAGVAAIGLLAYVWLVNAA